MNVNEEVEDATGGCLGVFYIFLMPIYLEIPRRRMARFRIDPLEIKDIVMKLTRRGIWGSPAPALANETRNISHRERAFR